MAFIQKTAAACEVGEEEFEDFEEEEMEEDVEYEDYEEEAEEEAYEEEEVEQVDEEQEEEEKKVVEVQKGQKEEESVQDPVWEEEKSANPEQPSASEGSALPPPVVFPPFLQSVSDLEKLHCSLSKFLHQWNSLNRSFDSITAAIDAHARSQHDVRSTEHEKDDRSEQEKDERSKKEKVKCIGLEIICNAMEGKKLRKYVQDNISELGRLRYEVPEALRRAPNPARLVFEAIGKFYTQGSRGYTSNMSLVSIRRASILLLEFFVLSGLPTSDSSVKEEAKLGALLWRKRLVNEGIETASSVDSLGLILFLACFGIPMEFGFKDLCLLLRKSNLKKKGDVFSRSSILIEKIPGVINDLIREEMYIEAAELSCCFGLNDTLPPLPMLSSFVAKVIQIGKQERREADGSLSLLNEANKRQLISLKSVTKFLEDHKIDVRNVGSIPIHQWITRLEKCIVKIARAIEVKGLNSKAEHLKTSFPSTEEASRSVSSQMIQDKPQQGFPAQPLLPVSGLVNSSISAGYLSLGMQYPAVQNFYQPQAASTYGNDGGSSGRNLYQFADTVIQHESHGKPNRSSNTSPAAAKFSHY